MGYDSTFSYLLIVGITGFLSACSEPVAVTEIAALSSQTPLPIGAPEVIAVLPEATWDDTPMGGWAVVNSLTELHATWTDYGVQSAYGPAPKDALVPYADAVTHHGESWALSTPSPTLLLIGDDGYAYRYPDGRHGRDPKEQPRLGLEADDPATRSWAAIEAGKLLYVDYSGSTMYVMGALRAAGQCGVCHEAGGEALLGAYYYVLHEIADD